jgi:hypothetical protein
MARSSLLVTLVVGVSACGGAVAVNESVAASSRSTAPDGQASVFVTIPIAPTPDVDLRDRNAAEVRGQHAPFDGIAEGLAWPSLDKALGPRASAVVVTIQAARAIRVVDVLRAAWTVRANDVRVQTPDENGTLRAAELGAKASAVGGSGCHLAVFLRPDGSLRVATPGGLREISADHADDRLAQALENERNKCPIKYIAFGAESDEMLWGPVFDLLVAVDRAKSAGDARYVLGQAVHFKQSPPAAAIERK